MKQRIIRRTLLALALSAFGASTMAQEIESNDSVSLANELIQDSTGTVTTTGYIGRVGGTTKIFDLDFFKFKGKKGDPIVIDISDSSNGGAPSATNLNSYLTLFEPVSETEYRKFRENDDATCDQGSVCAKDAKGNPVKDVNGNVITRDARIDGITLPNDGVYLLAVTALGTQFKNTPTDFVLPKDARSNGRYTLTISGLSPLVILMNIDIKPGGDHAVNPKSKGVVPVVLRAGKDFDPFKIDVSSLRFGVKGTEQSLRRCNDKPLGNTPDRLCHFDNEIAMESWESGITEAILTGQTTDKNDFEGRAPIKVHASPNDQ